MFSSLTRQLGTEVEALKKILGVNSRLRDLHDTGHLQKSSDASFVQILSEAPDRINWRVYDHCAGVTRLYALYEGFVVSLVEEYLRRLTDVFPSYADLPPAIRTQHRVGAGQILQKWSERGPYGHLTETSIASGIVDGLRGQLDYKLLSDAFLIDPHNYRAEILVKVFSHLGLADCFAFMKKQPEMQAFMLSRDATETPETVLHDIVELRNQASHGSVPQDEVVSILELFSYAEFVQMLCAALAEMVERRFLTRSLEVCQNISVGQVIHVFSDNVVGLRCCEGRMRVGERLVAKGAASAAGRTVIAMEINRQRCDEATLSAGQEIGLQLDKATKDGTELLRLSPRPTPHVSASQTSTIGTDNCQV